MNSEPVTNTDFSWIAAVLQTADTFYPTGAYAHSYGLEGLIDEGVVRDRDTLRGYLLHSVLPSLSHVELPLVVQAWHAFSRQDWDLVYHLSELSSALRSAKESRQAAESVGRQRVELCVRLRPTSLAEGYLSRASSGGWSFSPSLAAALEAQCVGAPLEAAMAIVYYGAISGTLSAAMKILRLGQNASQGLLTELMTHAGSAFAAARTIPVEEIGWFNPWLDIAAARHEHAAARLFIS